MEQAGSTPIYIIIGAISGLISIIVLLILHFQTILNQFRILFKWIGGTSSEIGRQIINWWWWRKQPLFWTITNNGNLEISKDQNNRYILQIRMEAIFQNDHSRYTLNIYGPLRLKVYHSGERWEKKPYDLPSANFPSGLEVPPSESIPYSYVFCEHYSQKPVFIGNSATCKIIGSTYSNISSADSYLRGGLQFRGKRKISVDVCDLV